MSKSTTEYVFVPGDDSEFGPVWTTDEAEQELAADELAGALPAELVLALEGARGHYLVADFLDEAVAILESVQLDTDRFRLDRPEKADLRERVEEVKAEAGDGAVTYRAWAAGDSTEVSPPETVYWTAERVEQLLHEFGFVVDWSGDGITVYRVESSLDGTS